MTLAEPTPALGLPRIPASLLEEAAGFLKITNLDGGATERWVPNDEQRQVWRAGEQHQRRYITKARRIGISTALDLEDVIWTMTCDNMGHRVRTGITMHVEDKLRERITQCASFLAQMDEPHDPATFSIGFPNGSEIVGVTAGGKGASRSEGFQRMRYEEYAFYPADAMGEISPSVGKGATETICTTIDIGAPNGIKAREMWDGANGFAKIFFPVEMHEGYRAPADSITDEQWAWAKAEGFTIREAAAYWLTELLPNKCEGDTIRAFREYPPTRRHMFQASERKWVRVSPEPRAPLEVVRILGVRGDEWPVHIYRQPKDVRDGALIGVDTAEGKGLDKGVVIVVDRRDWTPAAILASDRIIFDDLAVATLDLQRRYGGALALIEEMGIGSATVAHAATLGVVHDVVTPTAEGKYEGLLASKMAVESGLLFGPHELTIECDELHRDAKTGAFIGRKDILMAYGFCARRMKDAPWLPPKKPIVSEERIDGRRIIRNLMRMERIRGGLR